MSKPNRLFLTYSATDANAPAVDGTVVSGAATFYSFMVSGEDRQNLSGQIFWTGTPTGTFTLQFSNKPNPDETNDNDWSADTSTFTNPAGSAGSTPFGSTIVASAFAFHHRIKYVNASGSGTMTGWAYAAQMR